MADCKADQNMVLNVQNQEQQLLQLAPDRRNERRDDRQALESDAPGHVDDRCERG